MSERVPSPAVLVPAVRIPIDDPTQIAEARRLGMRMAADVGFNETCAGEIAIVITEASTNILKHARGGEILLCVNEAASDGNTQIEMLSLDRGPGMYDIERCIEDGYTTGSTPGHGLGAIRRLAQESDFYSVAGAGTAILARWAVKHITANVRAGLRAGAVNAPKRGEECCGDAWAIEGDSEIFTMMVADGLGHGYEAGQAAREAIRILRNHHHEPPGRLIDLVHHALRGFRGAAVAVARVNLDRGIVVYSGLGNVMSRIYAGSRHVQHLVSVNGTAGHIAGRIREFNYPWPADGLLIMHSDGLATGTGLESQPSLAFRDPSLIAGVLYRDFARGHDDATIVVAKAA